MVVSIKSGVEKAGINLELGQKQIVVKIGLAKSGILAIQKTTGEVFHASLDDLTRSSYLYGY
jgi:hypothetical protein